MLSIWTGLKFCCLEKESNSDGEKETDRHRWNDRQSETD